MRVLIKGAGDLASGIAFRLFHAGFDIIMTEIERPLAVRRTVAFSQAVYDGETSVEDVRAVLVKDLNGIKKTLAQKKIPVIADPSAAIAAQLKPAVLIDAIMAKKNTGTSITDAPVVICIGPGFYAGKDCHAVIETMRGHNLGRVITSGAALPNTGVPGGIGGCTIERLLRAGADGVFEAKLEIGSIVKKGDVVAAVNCENGVSVPINAGTGGVIRGLLPSNINVVKGLKAGDIDPRCEAANCFTVSDKALAIAGGVLEAILRFIKLTYKSRLFLPCFSRSL
ncbi:MAG: EF2563 family selenium-dependent molybdenum hydroxylase system protein [Spirochaetaceae bacterium]|jgi:xanthine dehydrogenase accessory factor|nr:EF2563 family selenium-dependent molybdenum hydroxylase system protein [Spirochaetaceae bacterium]